MNISDFVSQIGGGLARTNRFDVVITTPSSIDIEGLIPGQELAMLCEQVQLPGLTVNTTPIKTYGEVRETPYEFNYEPINMSFYVDNKMGVKIFFDKLIENHDIRDIGKVKIAAIGEKTKKEIEGKPTYEIGDVVGNKVGGMIDSAYKDVKNLGNTMGKILPGQSKDDFKSFTKIKDENKE